MTVKSDLFAQKMAEYWEQPPLSNVASDRLKAGWADMADTFNRHITGKVKGQWSILQLPTGTGKTQGLSLYCSLLPKNEHPGVLIVTNLVEEAKIIESDINRLSKKPGTALLCHAENKRAVIDSIPSTPVLIITHNAYKMAWEDGEREELYTKWKGGQRKLTVIDEALDIAGAYRVDIDDLRFLRGVVPQHIAGDFLEEMAVIDEAIEKIVKAVGKNDEGKIIRFKNSVSSFHDLFSEIKTLSLSAYAPGTANKCRDILKNLKAVSSDWSVYSSIGQHHTLGTARFLLPVTIKNAAVLDATVSENPISKMLGKKFDVRPLPEGIKNYANVKLHVSYGHNVGKTYLEKQGKDHFLELLDTLSSKLPKKDKTLLCVHKNNEHHFDDIGEKSFSLAHWYAINGSNAHRDCRAAIIYGLPYLPTDAATNILFAFLIWHNGIEGVISNEKKILETARKHTNDYILRHISAFDLPPINESRSGVNPDRFWTVYRRSKNGKEAIYGGADYRSAASGRGDGGPRAKHGGGAARDWRDGQYVLPLAQGIWRIGDGSGAAAQRA